MAQELGQALGTDLAGTATGLPAPDAGIQQILRVAGSIPAAEQLDRNPGTQDSSKRTVGMKHSVAVCARCAQV